MEDDQSSVVWSEEGHNGQDASLADDADSTSVLEQPSESVAWSEEGGYHERDASSVAYSVESASVRASPRVPVNEEESVWESEHQAPSPTPGDEASFVQPRNQATPNTPPTASPAPSTPPPISRTSYENVYCGDVEGKMDVTDDGIKFVPYVALPPEKTPPLHDIPWKETTYREFFQEEIKAGYKSYSTMITLFNIKIGVLPSREAKFSFRKSDEYDRFMCDLDARGYGAPPPPPQSTTPEVAPGFHPDDYDHAESVYSGREAPAPEEGVQFDDDEDEVDYDAHREGEEVDWSDEDENEDIDEARRTMRQTPPSERTDDEGDSVNLGWSTEDDTAAPLLNSSYYPVTCKRELGSLVLTDQQLQFVPDRHSATIKSIPYPAFAGRPFFSPWNYPRAQMAIHYHTTRGPNKKVGFDLPSHDELLRLEDDIRDRMRPFKNSPREQVYVPPKMADGNEGDSVSKPRGGGGSDRSMGKKKKFVVPPPMEPSVTEDETSYGMGGETYITAADQGVPLMANTARRVPYHKEEPSRRLVLLFISTCCIVTLSGLTFSILFGYYFGPRRPKEQYIRTQSPYDIGGNYLGTEPPTLAPTPKKNDAYESAVTMSRSITQPPEATVELPKTEKEKNEDVASEEEEEKEDEEVTVGNNFAPGIGAGIGRPVTPSNQVDMDEFGPGIGSGIGSGIGRPMSGSNANDRPGSGIGGVGSIAPGSNMNFRPGSGMGGGGSIRGNDFKEEEEEEPGGGGETMRGSDFDLSTSTSTLAPIETTIPSTLAPTEHVATDPLTAAASPAAAPSTGTPTIAPSTGTPTIAPSTGTPTTAPSTETPTIAPTTETPTGAPSTASPTDAPPTVSPTIAPSTAAPTSSPTTSAPTNVPTIGATRSSKAIVQLLMEKSPDKGQNLRTPGTAQQAAYLMMKVSGLLDNAQSDETIVQKYAMSTLYYAAGGNDWNEGSDDWKNLADSDCNKADVMCDAANQDTIGINMPKNNMKGSIPAEIGLLDKLKFISFHDNDLEGSVPTEMGLLKNLETLDLTGNPKLETVPEAVRTLPKLKTIKLDTP